MTGDEGEVVEEVRPVDRLVLGLQLLDHEANRLLQVVQAQLERLQQRVAHFLFALHRGGTLESNDAISAKSAIDACEVAGAGLF